MDAIQNHGRIYEGLKMGVHKPCISIFGSVRTPNTQQLQIGMESPTNCRSGFGITTGGGRNYGSRK